MSLLSEEDDDDDETFEVAVPRVRKRSHQVSHEDFPAVSTPEQKVETARKLSCMQRKLATTETFVQQMDYKAQVMLWVFGVWCSSVVNKVTVISNTCKFQMSHP